MYLWLKAVHIIAVISWMAGMLYLPRLFVYHAVAKLGSEQSETFKVMERRLLKFIINPAMTVAWLLGVWLVWSGGWLTAPWFLAKLMLVLVLSGVHGHLAAIVKQFAADQNRHSQKYYRIINEIPTVLMIFIVVLATVKPF
jgi:putative membrane protein